MSGRFSDDELAILSTGTIALLDSKACTKMRDGRFKIRCGDGKKRKVSDEFLLSLQDKLVVASGRDSIKEDIKEIREAVRHG